MNHLPNRREFLKLGGAASAGLLGSGVLRPISALAKEELERGPYDGGTWIPSCCHMCGGTTGIMCQVVDGRLARIKPNDNNPVGFSNISDDFFANAAKEGAVMCPKGNAGIMALYDPDRVKQPLRRTNTQKGIGVDPHWKAISWEEAYSEIVSRLRALRDGGEAHKLEWFSEDHCFTHIQSDFCKLFGTPNYNMHSNTCDTGRKASFKILMGDERPLIDAINSKFMLIFGWNPLSATKWSHLPRIITRGIERGAKLVIVDPHLSYTASKAHEWVPIRPATDGALALAMAHVIVNEGLQDQAFIDEWVTGFDQFKDYVKDKTPQWAEAITAVPAERIERLAREFATTKPALVDVWSGAHHTNGVYAGWAIGALAVITGNIEKPGALVLPEKKGNKHIEVEPDDASKQTLQQPRFDGGKDKWPYFHSSGVYAEIINRLVDGKGPYQPKMAMIVFQNLLMSVVGTKNAEEALKKLEFIVAVDTMLSETAQFADIVIPGTTYLERYDLNTHWVTWPVLGLRQPVVKPLFGQPAEYEFVCELGRRLNLKEGNGHDVFWIGRMSGERIEDKTRWYEEFLSKELKEGEPKITLEELKALPGATWVSAKGTRYNKHLDMIPPEKLADALTEGNLVFSKKKDGSKDKQIGMLRPDGTVVRGFFTPSGKLELYAGKHETKKDADGNPLKLLPVYEPRAWQPSPEFPLFLINWKEASQTHSRTQNNAFLAELKSTDGLRINTKTAAKLGVKHGDLVWVESPFGKVQMKAELTEGIHPQVVGTQHGWGHWAMGRLAKGRGAHTGFLAQTKACPLSGQSLNKEICVRVYPG
ncbi:MAG: molybdopterin-dependent oxidoreductase [Candidatus Omnitrophica bacterium]|nr:molybdopterin-dependent oxidoreductase [Candidatus Omnitrophota bacterium]